MQDSSTAIAELSELIKEKRPPGVSVSDFLRTLFETCASQIGANPSENEAKKIVLARGILARRSWSLLREAPCLLKKWRTLWAVPGKESTTCAAKERSSLAYHAG